MARALPPVPCVAGATHYGVDLHWQAAASQPDGDSERRCSYVVQFKPRDSLQKYADVYNGYSTHAEVTDLDPDTAYVFRVRARTPDGNETRWSKDLEAKTERHPPTGVDLHKAVENCDHGTIKDVIEKGVSPDVLDKYGQTPLMRAAQLGYEPVVETLLACGASLSVSNGSGKTSLMMAAFYGSVGIAKVLLLNGASLHERDATGAYPIHYACDSGKDTAIRSFLTSDPSLLEVVDNSGWTPLMRCAAMKGSVQVASALIEYGGDVNAFEPKTKKSVVMMATLAGNHDLVSLLVKSGARTSDACMHGHSTDDVAETLGNVLLDAALKKGKPDTTKKSGTKKQQTPR